VCCLLSSICSLLSVVCCLPSTCELESNHYYHTQEEEGQMELAGVR
jgi:hypothetical protein